MADSQHHNVFEDRRRKLDELREGGINPYPSRSQRTIMAQDVHDRFSDLEGSDQTVAGRVRAIRVHGKSAFVDLEDGSGRVQLFVRADVVGGEQFGVLKKLVDVGDFLQATGKVFLTKRKEQSIEVGSFRMLSKSLRPLPDKWHGLKNAEERYRRRYVDLIMNPEVRGIFETRSKIVSELRSYLGANDFLEVETPVLQQIPGGTTAKPFETHINAYDMDLYLRIAPELYLKRLVVGGFERVFEVARNFRNEGVDYSHNPEFTMFEFYWAYQDYEGLMTFTEEMLSEIIGKVTGSMKVQHGEYELDFTPPWPRVRISDAIGEKTGIDVLEVKDEEKLRALIREKGYEAESGASYLKLVDDLFKQAVRPEMIQPVIVKDHPVEMEPLAKVSESDPRVVERFQPVVLGFELLKAYTELNDPVEQLKRFREQQAERERGDDEAMFVDMDFVEALEYGMPPTAGWGMGVDRFVSVVTGSHALREVILFPFMRPRDGVRDGEDEKNQGDEAVGDDGFEVNPIADLPISRDEAVVMVRERFEQRHLVSHSIAVGAIMRVLAERFGADEVTAEAWEVAGVLHDLDYEDTIETPEQHGLQTADELEKLGVDTQVVQAVKAHNEVNGTVRNGLFDDALYAADPVSGFLAACALVRPDKKIGSVKLKSAKKKFGQASFAKGAKRDAIAVCEEFGMSVENFLELSLQAMSGVADELGL